MDLVRFIDQKLTQMRESSEGNLSNVSDDFILAYGPYMCMHAGAFERECDEIAQYNNIMQLMLHAAFLIRKISAGISYGDSKKLIREFIVSVDESFPSSDFEVESSRNSLLKFASDYLTIIRDEQKANKHLESFMTCASPIVPYDETLRKVDANEATRVDISTKLQDAMNKSYPPRFENRRKYLITLLLDNLAEIMTRYELCTVLADEVTQNPNLLKLDRLVLEMKGVPSSVQAYYFLATVNYYNIPDQVFEKYLNFFKEAGDFGKLQSYSAFEAMIDEMSENTLVDISLESWEDPTMDEKSDAAIDTLIHSHSSDAPSDIEVSYSFCDLEDYLNVNTYMKFEEYPNRLFVSSLENRHIININDMGGNRIFYELDNRVIACPFLDLRDYVPKVVVLNGRTGNIAIMGMKSF